MKFIIAFDWVQYSSAGGYITQTKNRSFIAFINLDFPYVYVYQENIIL